MIVVLPLFPCDQKTTLSRISIGRIQINPGLLLALTIAHGVVVSTLFPFSSLFGAGAFGILGLPSASITLANNLAFVCADSAGPAHLEINSFACSAVPSVSITIFPGHEE